jgi:hypothetical protein
MIQQHNLCQLHAVFHRFSVGIPVSHIETIDQVDIEEILLMWRWTTINVIFNIPNVTYETFEQIRNQKPQILGETKNVQ